MSQVKWHTMLAANYFPKVNRREYVFSGIKYPTVMLNFLKLLSWCFQSPTESLSADPQLVYTITAPLQLGELHHITATEVSYLNSICALH